MVLSPTEHLDSAKISSNGFKFSTIVFKVCYADDLCIITLSSSGM